MKALIFLFLVGFSLTYNPSAAVSYARRYCKNYNGKYIKYPGADCANFVSQCMKAGGMSFNDCKSVGWVNENGCMPNVGGLKSCLKKKKWKEYSKRPNCFKAGYPFFYGNSHAVIASFVNGNNIKYCGHTNDRCDQPLSDSVLFYCPS